MKFLRFGIVCARFFTFFFDDIIDGFGRAFRFRFFFFSFGRGVFFLLVRFFIRPADFGEQKDMYEQKAKDE